MTHNGEWKVKQAEFQGYVKKGLEGIEERLDRHDSKFDRIFINIEKNDKAIERLKVKMGIIAAGAGIIFATVWSWVKSMWR